MGEETKPAVSRRGLLRRTATVAAGVGVVGAASATPALAANGDNITVGGTVSGTSKTSLTTGDGNNPALKLANASSSGAPLELAPVNFSSGVSPVSAAANPVGTTYVDRWGDVHVVGDAQVNAGPHYDLMLYSPSWATAVYPFDADRIVHTYQGSNIGLVSGATYDSIGRVIPKFSNSVPDMWIDLSGGVDASSGVAAVQLNLTIENALVQSGVTGPWAAMWGNGDAWPGTSSISFQYGGHATSNFVQVPIGTDGKLRLKLYARAIVVIDVVGLVLSDAFAQAPWLFLSDASAASISAASIQGARGAAAPAPTRKMVPRRK